MRAFLMLFFLLGSLAVQAQGPAELWVTPKDDTWNIAHTVQRGETVFMLARRYHVPPAILADANGLSYQDGLKLGSTVTVPLGAYNLITQKPAGMSDARPLYYKVQQDDNLYRVSRHAGVPQRTLIQWNNLGDNGAVPGKKLLVGWVLYDATQIGAQAPAAPAANNSATTGTSELPRSNTPKPAAAPPVVMTPKPDTAPSAPVAMPDTMVGIPAPQPVATLKDLFEEQTMQEQNLVWEKGTAGFFAMTTQAKGASVFAFHNKAAKGSVIRVKNMNNGRVVYVKVLGPVPNTKQFYNCILGLSGSAKAALGVRDEKAFCELSYAGY